MKLHEEIVHIPQFCFEVYDLLHLMRTKMD